MKFISLDSIIGTTIVFVMMAIFPWLFSFKFFEPFAKTISDFQITDIETSQIAQKEFFGVDTNITIINVKDIDNRQLIWLMVLLNSMEPKAIGVERILKTNGDSVAAGMLRDLLTTSERIVLGSRLEKWDKTKNEYLSLNRPDISFSDTANTGYTNLILEGKARSSTVREYYAVQKCQNQQLLSYSAKIAGKFSPEALQYLKARNRSNEIIYYRGNFSKFFFLRSDDFLVDTIPEGISNFIKDKIVLLGEADIFMDFRDLEDVYFTPLDSNYSGKYFPNVSGTEIQANIISSIINKNYYETMPGWVGYLLAFILAYLNFHLFFLVSEKKGEWYEIVSNGTFFLESIGLVYLAILLFREYLIEARLTIPLLSAGFTLIMFEIYRDSIKPISHRIFNKYFGKEPKNESS